MDKWMDKQIHTYKELFIICLPALEHMLHESSDQTCIQVLGTGQTFHEYLLVTFIKGEEQVWGKKSRVKVISMLNLRCLLGILVEKLSRQCRYTRLKVMAEVGAMCMYIFLIRQDTNGFDYPAAWVVRE